MLIPPFFMISVVALGGIHTIQIPGQPDRQEWQTEGTGFFYGYRHGSDEKGKATYGLYLVTAAHVVREHLAAGLGDLHVRVNPTSGQVKEFSVPTSPPPGSGTWFYHPDPKIDVAAVKLNANVLEENDIEPGIFFASDQHTLDKKMLAEQGISAGDGIFVLGFPMGLSGEKRNYVIARAGIIARMSEMIDGASNSFMIDANVYPGNSGGPVVLKPEAISIEGTKAHNKADLIGLVTSYRPYTDIAISAQTRKPRIVFQENSGLAEVLPMDLVNEAISAWEASLSGTSVDPVMPKPELDDKGQ